MCDCLYWCISSLSIYMKTIYIYMCVCVFVEWIAIVASVYNFLRCLMSSDVFLLLPARLVVADCQVSTWSCCISSCIWWEWDIPSSSKLGSHNITGWWFQTLLLFSIIYWGFLPIDFHIFQMGRSTTNQIKPPVCKVPSYICYQSMGGYYRFTEITYIYIYIYICSGFIWFNRLIRIIYWRNTVIIE